MVVLSFKHIYIYIYMCVCVYTGTVLISISDYMQYYNLHSLSWFA
jgi:hypothetical protein